MKFISTRGQSAPVSALRAVLDGAPPDGGLYVPVQLPRIDCRELLHIDSVERLCKILALFFERDFDLDGLDGAWSDGSCIVKVDELLYSAEAFGATRTVSDIPISVAARILGVTVAQDSKCAESGSAGVRIVVPADVDTCASALLYFSRSELDTVALYPSGAANAMQSRLVQSCASGGKAAGVKCELDGIADEVRKVCSTRSGDSAIAFCDTNLAYVVPVVAYMFCVYCDLAESGAIEVGERIDIAVPAVNAGIVAAAYIAKAMGLPVDVTCAVRELNAAHVERGINEYKKIFKDMRTARASEDDCADAMYDAFDEYGYLIGPDTGAAYDASMREELDRVTVLLSVDEPYKHSVSVLKAIGEKPRCKEEGEKAMEALSFATATEPPELLLALFDKPTEHITVSVDNISDFIGQ